MGGPEAGGPEATGRRCGVLGDPIAHSLSPTLHRAGYAALGLDWEYDAHRVGPGGLRDFLDGLGAEWRGLSLTMPLKREAVGVVDDLTERARLAGAANTVLLEGDRRVGDNTDVPGAIAAIRERTGAHLTSAAILGGGATATSVGLALADLGVRSLALVVREPARAAETREALNGHPGRPDVVVGILDDPAPLEVDLVASTIPAEAQDHRLVARCRAAEVVFEVLYHPWPTPLAASAGDRVLVSGLDLLLHQAAVQFELFTGHRAPLAAMRAAGEQALAARSAAGDPRP
ncbi:shikimate dehydrogenase [Nocardioides sp. Soil777]|jgi:shikimate dehydrogenase|uniref:shikimate dehydrogenase n=1 Tax=Nocardioides sp. Soil777 TaxID=1736409 RepID=UPI0007033630|nr:shikimate dehydrogenase [Nocardioides sp. Soil777]KRE98095.1 shikimate dehydrogenase [Nocardioides sp. Soil777]